MRIATNAKPRLHQGRLGVIAGGTMALAIGIAFGAESGGEGQNMAKGAKYTLSPQPRYEHCTDTEDGVQLTDGKLTEGYFWTQKGTVGWSSAKFVSITVDLGKVEPIGGASFRTAAGTAGVCWPATLRIQVSDDGKAYRDVGDLIILDSSSTEGLPEGYAVKQFRTTGLRTRGRFVRFLVLPTGSYTFVDEVEVFRGPDSLLQADPGGEPAPNEEAFYARCRIQAGVRHRQNADAANVEGVARKAALDEGVRAKLLERLTAIRQQLLKVMPRFDATFRAILPLNEPHGELFKIQAAVWKAQGGAPVVAWAVPAWDPVDPFEAPPKASNGSIEVHTMLGEYRAAALNIANSGEAAKAVSVSFKGLPESPGPAYVAVHEIPWTDTVTGRPVAAALPEVARGQDGWSVNVLPGLVRQIWLTFHVTVVPAGEHQGAIVLRPEGGEEISLPVRLHVYPVRFPAKTTLWLGGWSYTNGRGSYGVTPENHKPFVDHLRSRFVNAPWATSAVMMNFEFTTEDPPTIRLKTEEFDEWLTQWPDARAYLVFASVGSSFAGAGMGTPAFNQRVAAWISAWVEHLNGKGIAPDRLGLLLVDEPYDPKQDQVIIGWAKAIRAAQPKVMIWEDPTYHDPTKGLPEMFELSTILCPNRPMWLGLGKPFQQFYLDQQRKGRVLQFYSCSGPARDLDPYSYYRLQAWHCWQIGATGSFFWAFGDTGYGTSWNEYSAVHGPFTPLYLDATTVTGGKQMEAIRESVEDYEYLVMLRQAVEGAGGTGAAVEQAKALLKSAADEVLGAPDAGKLQWHEPKDRTGADSVRVKLLRALTALQAAT